MPCGPLMAWHLLLALMNSFIKTEAAIFLMQAMLFEDLTFVFINICILNLTKRVTHY